jgi:hypothetical protein
MIAAPISAPSANTTIAAIRLERWCRSCSSWGRWSIEKGY